jgi:hypothetical protein
MPCKEFAVLEKAACKAGKAGKTLPYSKFSLSLGVLYYTDCNCSAGCWSADDQVHTLTLNSVPCRTGDTQTQNHSDHHHQITKSSHSINAIHQLNTFLQDLDSFHTDAGSSQSIPVPRHPCCCSLIFTYQSEDDWYHANHDVQPTLS